MTRCRASQSATPIWLSERAVPAPGSLRGGLNASFGRRGLGCLPGQFEFLYQVYAVSFARRALRNSVCALGTAGCARSRFASRLLQRILRPVGPRMPALAHYVSLLRLCRFVRAEGAPKLCLLVGNGGLCLLPVRFAPASTHPSAGGASDASLGSLSFFIRFMPFRSRGGRSETLFCGQETMFCLIQTRAAGFRIAPDRRRVL